MSADKQVETLNQFHDLYFAVRRSIKYHDYRQRHFKFWGDCFTFLTIVLGLMGMILLTYGRDLFELNESVLKPIQYVPLLAITVINSLLLVFRLGDKAQLHTSLRIQFQKLAVYLKNLEIKGELSSDAIAEGNQRRAEIEVDEPKTLRVLDTRCHNETNQALGYKHNYFHLTKWQTFWSKYWDVGTLSNEPYDIPG